MKITLDRRETSALNGLRGMPEAVQMLILCSTRTATGGELEGTRAELEALVDFIGTELADGLVSPRDEPPLVSLCEKITPGCSDWLGE